MASTRSKTTIKIIILSVFFMLIVGYGLFGSREMIAGVKIKDVNLEDGKKVEENILSIEGNAKNALSLTLNGRVVSIDEHGNFRETIALLLGYNTVSIFATDKFGNVDEKTYQLTYLPSGEKN